MSTLQNTPNRRPKKGRKPQYNTAEEIVAHRQRYMNEYYQKEEVKERLKIYQARKKQKRQIKSILKKFSENEGLCKNTLNEVIQNEQLFHILKELLESQESKQN
jgi:Holliday junction resolvasome RuvABC ATP-dependent DNA helicase subunit